MINFHLFFSVYDLLNLHSFAAHMSLVPVHKCVQMEHVNRLCFLWFDWWKQLPAQLLHQVWSLTKSCETKTAVQFIGSEFWQWPNHSSIKPKDKKKHRLAAFNQISWQLFLIFQKSCLHSWCSDNKIKPAGNRRFLDTFSMCLSKANNISPPVSSE